MRLTAYANLRDYLGLPTRQPQILFLAEQMARFEQDVAERLETDFAFVLPQPAAGVDTQGVLGSGAPEQVRADVQRNIEALAPGGGFVFVTVHDIQADVPPANIMAMREAWREYGRY